MNINPRLLLKSLKQMQDLKCVKITIRKKAKSAEGYQLLEIQGVDDENQVYSLIMGMHADHYDDKYFSPFSGQNETSAADGMPTIAEAPVSEKETKEKI